MRRMRVTRLNGSGCSGETRRSGRYGCDNGSQVSEEVFDDGLI